MNHLDGTLQWKIFIANFDGTFRRKILMALFEGKIYLRLY